MACPKIVKKMNGRPKSESNSDIFGGPAFFFFTQIYTSSCHQIIWNIHKNWNGQFRPKITQFRTMKRCVTFAGWRLHMTSWWKICKYNEKRMGRGNCLHYPHGSWVLVLAFTSNVFEPNKTEAPPSLASQLTSDIWWEHRLARAG